MIAKLIFFIIIKGTVDIFQVTVNNHRLASVNHNDPFKPYFGNNEKDIIVVLS